MDDSSRKAVEAIPPVVASLGAWGVVDGRWLPHEPNEPVIWLRTRTEIERVALEAQPWPLAQVRIILIRLGVPYSISSRVRLEVTSLETQNLSVED